MQHAILRNINYSHFLWGTAAKCNLEKLRILQKMRLIIVSLIFNVHYDFPAEKFFEKRDIRKIYRIFKYRLFAVFNQE